MGCWRDKAQPRALHIIGRNISPPDVILKCFIRARDNGYKVFALQWGQECYVGANDGSYMKYGKATNCDDKGTGGWLALEVYRIK